MNNIHEKRFKVTEIAAASGIPVGTIHMWFKRGNIQIEMKDRRKAADGPADLFSGRVAIVLAIAGALKSLGVSVRTAVRAAEYFAHLGDEKRAPASLFDEGNTILTVAEKCVDGPRYSVFQVLPNTKFSDVVSVNSFGQNSMRGVVLVELDEIVMGVRQSLGIDQVATVGVGEGKDNA